MLTRSKKWLGNREIATSTQEWWEEWNEFRDHLTNFLLNFKEIETAERYLFLEANSIQVSTFKRQLGQTFNLIPKRLATPFCKDADSRSTWDEMMRLNGFEEYLSPNEETHYRVSSFYLQGSDEARFKFQGVGYGDFTVCLSRERNMLSKECKSVLDIENVWFNITRPCSSQNANDGCLSVYFSLSVDTTYMKCSESDCRFPDDVRILVRPEGLRCERSGIDRLSTTMSFLVLIFVIVKIF